MSAEPAGRSRLAISLGTLMLLVLAVAVWLGWVTNRARSQRRAIEKVKEHGGWVHFDYEYVKGTFTPNQEPRAPLWLRRLVGDEYFREIASVSLVYDDTTGKRFDNYDFTPGVLPALEGQMGLRRLLLEYQQASDDGLRHIGGLPNLEDLYIWNSTGITDKGIAQLQDLTNLKALHIDHSQMTDQGFLALARLTKLEYLALECHTFSDKGLAVVDGMPGLTWLSVGGDEDHLSEITDAGLRHVEGLRNLVSLDLSFSEITDDGLDSLKGLSHLSHLTLASCPITDRGVAKLSGLKNLERIILNETKVTDKGVELLVGLPRLKLLAASGTAVTQEERDSIEQRNPRINVR